MDLSSNEHAVSEDCSCNCLPIKCNLCKEIKNDLEYYRDEENRRKEHYEIVFNNENTLEMTSEVQITNTTSPANIVLTNNRRNQTKDSIDLESKLNRIYSFLLVKYFWIFLIVGLFLSISFSAFSLLKQPLPNILDVRRGFSARGEGTLTSQLIIMKNVKKEMDKREKQLIDLYEQVKIQNISKTKVLTTQIDYSNEEINDDYAYEDYTTEQIGIKQTTAIKDDYEDYAYEGEDEEGELNDEQKEIKDIKIKRDLSINEDNRQINSRYRYNDLMKNSIIDDFSGRDLMNLLPNINISYKNNPLFNTIDKCDYSLSLDKNFEFYFKAKDAESYATNIDETPLHKNLLTLENLKSLCEWDKRLIEILLGKFSLERQCYFSLPFVITTLSSKQDCSQLTQLDINSFEQILQECYPLYQTGILYTAALESRTKSTLETLLDSNNLQTLFVNLPEITSNICFKKNFMYLAYEYLMDNSSLIKSNFSNLSIEYSSLWIMNEQTFKNGSKARLYNSEDAFNFYMKYLYDKTSILYNLSFITEIAGINLIGVREEAAMRFITQDMLLVVIAISLICLVTLIYMRSISIAIVVNLGVGLSVGISFFAYRIVYDLDLFPFLNMMSAFILIGIACDNVFVLFDCWFQEKYKLIWDEYHFDLSQARFKYSQCQNANGNLGNPDEEIDEKYKQLLGNDSDHIDMFVDKNDLNLSKKIKYDTQTSIESNVNKRLSQDTSQIDYELNPIYVRKARLSDKQLTKIMGGTLRHAASSIFVTSFTTAAAFLTNLITLLPTVQLFGVFTGTCILVYFLLVITMICSFVILYEKYSHKYDLVDYIMKNIKSLNKLHYQFEKLMGMFTRLNHKIMGFYLPKFLIQFKLYLVIIFFLIGIFGMITVFYKPKLTPPQTWRVQFFKSHNQFEVFEMKLRDRFLSYHLNEKRNLTNPEIFFLFGILNRDTGYKFNPDDDGYLVYDKKFNFKTNESQIWLHNFITKSLAKRRDLFLVDDLVNEWENYFKQIQLLCFSTLGLDPFKLDSIHIPYEPSAYKKCQFEIGEILKESTVDSFEGMIASSPRRFIFVDDENLDAKLLLLRVNANRTLNTYTAVSDYFYELAEFHSNALEGAPDGYKTGWFISIGFAIYDLQYQLIHGTYSSLIASMCIALIILLLTSGNVIISFFAIITISFSIATTIAIFVYLGWHLNILESIVIIMSVGLCVDFSCHYGVAYMKSEYRKSEKKKFKNFCEHYKHGRKERSWRIYETFKRVGSAVMMAACTTFLAGLSMYPSRLVSFMTMGQFLMLVMFISYVYSTFFFVPLCALLGPTNHFGDIKLNVVFNRLTKVLVACLKLDKKLMKSEHKSSVDDEDLNEKIKLPSVNNT